MKLAFLQIRFLVVILIIGTLLSCDTSHRPENWQWETVSAIGEPVARHEAGLVAFKDKILLLGGRRINPTNEFDTNTNTWTTKSPTPIELHHFQPVAIGNAVYLIGAMTGQWPNEQPLNRVIIYYPEEDRYEYSHEIPVDRRRGGAGAVVRNGKIYLIGGITKGHMNGYKPWFDEYNPKTGEWKVLADAPDARDHFQAAIVHNKLYAFAGRRTSKITEQDMALTSSHGNVYDFDTETWKAVTTDLKIPTERAGNSIFAWNNSIIVGGGESIAHEVSHNEVEAYNSKTKQWIAWPDLKKGRHGTGFAVVNGYVYTASGSGNRGGGPELTTIERLELPKQDIVDKTTPVKMALVFKQWHTVTLDFEGPPTSETADDNPFLNYKLLVTFKHKDSETTIRGFYAADGNASETSAKSGNIWRVRFSPDKLGTWEYTSVLYHRDSIAVSNNFSEAQIITLANPRGSFVVSPSDKARPDFRASGQLSISNGFYKFKNSEKYWIKGGTNSPENLLGYVDFDDTYRRQTSNRDGEARTTTEIHTYEPHLKDWKPGDPTWKNGKGKSLIGAINYLSSKGMNSAYFLTLNILGDGKDVWPYENPEDFTRFDVSKLAQWELVFDHMQAKGIMLHMVTQETENETMLDAGETGVHRQLYLSELIARFGHHLALTWNLGEENGPASWSPVGQNDRQRKVMARFIKETDPYEHPVLLHTHSHDPLRSATLDSIIGYPYLDGLSLQQDKREQASTVVAHWKNASKENGKTWLISMDEIGMWHIAALPDAQDLNHDTLRQYALWGTLMSGGAGVEWYFGAKHPHNDINSEDWRQRDRLWEITKNATSFFEEHLPYWEMTSDHSLVSDSEAYCLYKSNEVYAIYLPNKHPQTIDLRDTEGTFNVSWFDPLRGGSLQLGSVQNVAGGRVQQLGKPPSNTNQDWICLLKKLTIKK